MCALPHQDIHCLGTVCSNHLPGSSMMPNADLKRCHGSFQEKNWNSKKFWSYAAACSKMAWQQISHHPQYIRRWWPSLPSGQMEQKPKENNQGHVSGSYIHIQSTYRRWVAGFTDCTVLHKHQVKKVIPSPCLSFDRDGSVDMLAARQMGLH